MISEYFQNKKTCGENYDSPTQAYDGMSLFLWLDRVEQFHLLYQFGQIKAVISDRLFFIFWISFLAECEHLPHSFSKHAIKAFFKAREITTNHLHKYLFRDVPMSGNLLPEQHKLRDDTQVFRSNF